MVNQRHQGGGFSSRATLRPTLGPQSLNVSSWFSLKFPIWGPRDPGKLCPRRLECLSPCDRALLLRWVSPRGRAGCRPHIPLLHHGWQGKPGVPSRSQTEGSLLTPHWGSHPTPRRSLALPGPPAGSAQGLTQPHGRENREDKGTKGRWEAGVGRTSRT